MNKMTSEEARERMIALHNARKIFIETGLTKNITLALEAYQEIFAKDKFRLRLSAKHDGNSPRTIMDDYERPRCPVCDTEMKFKLLNENETGIRTQLVCKNPECDVVLSDTHDLQWWMENLKKKDGKKDGV